MRGWLFAASLLVSGCSEHVGIASVGDLDAAWGDLADGASNDDGGRPTNPTPAPTCVHADFPARPLPLELALIVDADPTWAMGSIAQAVVQFADAADLSNLSLSLSLLPHPTALDQCDFNTYLTPFVPMTPVPLVADDLRAAFAATRNAPGRNAPRPALAGTLNYLRQRQQVTPLAQHAALLIVDYLSSYCSSTESSVAAVAAEAYAEEPSILTAAYVPGGISPSALDTVALAGGTGAASYGDLNPGAGATWESLVEDLRLVRKKATACSFAMPVPEEGKLDTTRVQVLFRERPELPVVTLPLLESIDGCFGGRDGFYYDNPVAPRVMRLCPASCAIARSAAEAAELVVAAECLVLLE